MMNWPCITLALYEKIPQNIYHRNGEVLETSLNSSVTKERQSWFLLYGNNLAFDVKL